MASRKQFVVHVDPALCKGTEGCSLCLTVCEHDVLRQADAMNSRGVHPVEVQAAQLCNGCGLCVLHCPDLAIWLERPAMATTAV